MKSLPTALALASLALAATPVVAQAPAAPSDATFVAKAAASDQFEIRSSQIALRKTQNTAVRGFAQMMIDHHSKTSADLMAAVKAANLPAPPMTLPQDKQEKLDGLDKGASTGFDQRYMQEQVTGHQEALALHQAYARSGGNADLRTVATKAVPIVQQHLAQAQTLVGTANMPSPGSAR